MRRSIPAENRAVLFTALCALAACENQCFIPPEETVLSVDFVSPTEGKLLTYVDDVAPGTAGFQYDVTVRAFDSQGRGVTLEGAVLQTRLPSETTFTTGPAAQLDGAGATFAAVDLRLGINVIQVTVTEADSARTATKTIQVDAQFGRPEVLTLRFQGDANSDGALNQAEQATGDPVALVTVRGVEDGQPVTVKDQGAAGTVFGTGVVSGGAATVTLSGLGINDTTEATFQVVASVVDRAGRDNVTVNPTVSQPLNTAAFKDLLVDRVLPQLTLLSPNVPGSGQILSMTDDADPAAAGFQVRVAVQTSADVGMGAVSVSHSPPGVTDMLTPDLVNHRASVDFTVPDSGPFDYSVDINIRDAAGNSRGRAFSLQIGEGGTFGFFNGVAFSDSSAVKVPVNRTVPLGGAQAIVAATNVSYWSASTPAELPGNVIVDQDLATPGAQVRVEATVAGGATCTPKLLFDGNTVASGVVLATNSPGTVTLSATVASGTAGPMRFVADCGNGRIFGRPANNLTVDVDPPSPMVPTLALLTAAPHSPRRPALAVTWTSGNDDGSSNSGSAAEYLVGWSTDAATPHVSQPQVPADYDAVTGIEGDLMYWAPAPVRMGPFQETNRTALLTGLPSVGAYYVQVRTKDDVGNLSPIAPTPSCPAFTGSPVNGTCIDYQLNLATIENNGLTAAGGCIGFYMTAGDVNGDGRSDLAFISNSTTAAVSDAVRNAFIAYGNSNMATFATSSTLLAPPASAIDPVTGYYDAAVGNVGDRAGDAPTADLLYAAPRWATGRGRYLIYFGRPGGGTVDAANPVELRGLGASSNVQIGSRNDVGWARIVPDFGRPGGGAPDGVAEVAISAHNENGGLGRVYLFYGRPHDTAGGAGSWEALRQTDTDGLPYIPVTAADKVFDGETAPTCMSCGGPPANPTASYFGTRRGFTGLGDLDGDGVTDFAIPDARDFVNRMYLYSGALVAQLAGASVPPSGAHLLQRLASGEPTQGALPSGTLRGFGSDAAGGLNILRGPGTDLVVGFAVNNSVSVYADATASGFTGTPLSIAGMTSRFGKTVAVADVNGDGRLDLVIGSDAGIALGDGFPGGAYVMYNTGQSGAEFDSSRLGVHVSRLKRAPGETLRSDSMGIAVAAGDFNGDGLADVAVADHRMGDPTATTQGKIFVRY